MQLHQLKPIHKPKKKKRLGQGDRFGGRGSGTRGQKARAGRKLKPLIRVLIKRYPKLRGYKFKPVSEKPVVINIETLNKKFKAGDKINPRALLEKKLISKIKGRMPKVKILGHLPPKGRVPGEITKKLIIEGCQVSKKAKEKIEKAGGTIRE
ncbi:MAG: 50S ribosomal protein L15 [Candidatus Nealsonbacteria bacterium CG_4_10_14_0_8_um_filter_35_10]|uniref:Large ribosomal subunit protein uL15 n=2 Tax=Candidatus Nealsoniibacteriota TaxID=1817911 RepID=A0A2M7R8B8_9BACT|nr:MAG: 50S ribosomal protein L15 [Parcubacteria group bacterium CG1_02_36_42]PIY90818.1 MAG: 50S ribosomal protein L15 [Candidatus Nealsonbacteria bacterium CG_4_10_14_0_8_um_filter_35_10]PJB99698.1 MAG: 50S ribosomal protein L15 [Candidatus Nealsonbacteria bacterium CG_4_9_14_0_8_um_filter_35_12]